MENSKKKKHKGQLREKLSGENPRANFGKTLAEKRSEAQTEKESGGEVNS